jgi:uncharacterized protein (TIGR00369 family)
MNAPTPNTATTEISFEQAAKNKDFAALIAHVPYAQFLGLAYDQKASRFTLPIQNKHIGNPYLPALHGGVVAGFMENAALLQCVVDHPQNRIPKPINIQIDYLRSAAAKDCYADVEMVRLGRRVATLQVRCWQIKPEKPVATARVHLLLE